MEMGGNGRNKIRLKRVVAQRNIFFNCPVEIQSLLL